MQDFKVFSKTYIICLIFLCITLLTLSAFFQYTKQIDEKVLKFNEEIQTEVKKSIHKKIFEIEASLKSLSSFYQASDDFSTSTFTYVSQDLINYYPIIENIIYSKLVYEEDIKDFYKDMYNNGLFNYKIKSKSKKEYYLAITDIAPDSYKYSKYYGFDISKNKNFEKFFKDLSISSKIGYLHKKILNEKKDLLHLSQATYFGTNIPEKAYREEQTSGYFIISINLENMLQSLKNEFPKYTFSLKKIENINFKKEANIIKEVKVSFINLEEENIFIYYPLYFEDLNLNKILINSFLLFIFIIVFIYIIYAYKKNILYKEFSQGQINKSEKLASLGQMIGNISHQWRQPLSAISMIASSIQVKKEMGILDLEDVDKNMKDIINKTEYLSQTINIFRDFIKEKKNVQELYLEDRIKQAMSIVGLVLMDNNIKVIDTIDYTNKTKLKMVAGELDQVLINIVNNAKDILIENKIPNPSIEINLIKENDYLLLSIEDNAGGIPKNIMPKIFDPYFTTKHQSQGTGLGLHMSYRIINESLKGKLYVKNTNKGAKFFIELPLS